MKKYKNAFYATAKTEDEAIFKTAISNYCMTEERIMDRLVILTWNDSTPPRLLPGIFSSHDFAVEFCEDDKNDDLFDDYFLIVDLRGR